MRNASSRPQDFFCFRFRLAEPAVKAVFLDSLNPHAEKMSAEAGIFRDFFQWLVVEYSLHGLCTQNELWRLLWVVVDSVVQFDESIEIPHLGSLAGR